MHRDGVGAACGADGGPSRKVRVWQRSDPWPSAPACRGPVAAHPGRSAARTEDVAVRGVLFGEERGDQSLFGLGRGGGRGAERAVRSGAACAPTAGDVEAGRRRSRAALFLAWSEPWRLSLAALDRLLQQTNS